MFARNTACFGPGRPQGVKYAWKFTRWLDWGLFKALMIAPWSRSAPCSGGLRSTEGGRLVQRYLRARFRKVVPALRVAGGSAVRYATQELAARSLTMPPPPSADDQLLSGSPIVAGGRKSPKLMLNPRPYAYYNSTALEVIATAHAVLIIGYGFGGAHVNAWIAEYLRTQGRKRLAIVAYRTGRDMAQNVTPTEVFLRKVARGGFDDIYIPVEGGRQPRALHGPVGEAYFVAGGVPLAADVEEAVVRYLLRDRS